MASLVGACAADPPEFESDDEGVTPAEAGTDDDSEDDADDGTPDGGGSDDSERDDSVDDDDSGDDADSDDETDDSQSDDEADEGPDGGDSDDETDDSEADDGETDDETDDDTDDETDDGETDDETDDGETDDSETDDDAPSCGDGLISGDEGCEDGNGEAGDGCDADCAVEDGWSCDGDEPSGCSEDCGDGLVVGAEECDDEGEEAGDGCSALCTVEEGWTCDGQPSECETSCGDGIILGAEACDDENAEANDGCSAECAVESGWACSGEPSSCAETCGNGELDDGELCDDGGNSSDDGCDATCQPESGYACQGAPSVCALTCGNGDLDDGETCDDENLVANDGCTPSCAIETGWSCTGTPSDCSVVCGNGEIHGDEECDDDNTDPNDGCSATCSVETDWSCTGEPSDCVPDCGNGELDQGEECDDGNAAGADGCVQCAVQDGWDCDGEPSDCSELQAPVISAFSSSLGSVPGGGGEVLLAWSVTGADQLRIDAEGMNDIGVVTGSLLNVNVTADVTFTLVAENAAGETQQSVAVQVNSIGESDWISQFGTTELDQAYDVAVALDGSVYVAGSTFGGMQGSTRGGEDAFLVKFNSTGTERTTAQLGSTLVDAAWSVDVDTSGNVYISGQTYGAIKTGSTNSGTSNCFFAKYDASLNFQWAEQFAAGRCKLAVGGSAVYVGYGSGTLTVLRKYALTGGSPAWTKEWDFAQNSDTVTDVVADDAAAYVVGNSFDAMGGGAATAVGYTSGGTKLWDEEWGGGSYTYLANATLANGVLYATGGLYGGASYFDDSAGGRDGVVAFHYAASNGEITQETGIQFGSGSDDNAYDVAVDARGNFIVVGVAGGALAQGQSAGGFVTKRSPSNTPLWTRQFGTAAGTSVYGVAIAPNGMVFAVGRTSVELSSERPAGDSTDAFIIGYK